MLRIDGGTSRAANVEPPPPPPPPPPRPPVTPSDANADQVNAKARELSFAGALLGAKLARMFGAGRGEGPSPAPSNPITTANSGIPTSARYSVGPPTRPPIHHDNGFLQNPNDPNDPNPIPTEFPSPGDIVAYEKQRIKADAGMAIQHLPDWMIPEEYEHYKDLPDGIAAYHHFLNGGGRDRNFSYEEFVADDPAGRTTLNNATRDTQLGAEEIYRQMIERDPSLRNQTVTFEMTGTQIGVGGSNSKYPYPQTENWQKAIGAHQIWNSATVTVTPPTTPGGKPQFSMRMTLHAEDRYNFNPGAADIATGTPDAENGRFERVGLAHQYMNYATLQRDVRWEQGNPQAATSTPVDTGR